MDKSKEIAMVVEVFAYLFGMVVLFSNLHATPELWLVLIAVCALLIRLFATNEKADGISDCECHAKKD